MTETDIPTDPAATIAMTEEGMPATQDLGKLLQFCGFLATSDFIPAEHRGKRANVLHAYMMGQRLDVDVATVLKNLTVIHGRATIWGDLALALAQRHKAWCGMEEEIVEMDDDDVTAVCTVHRLYPDGNVRSLRKTFSVEDAKKAKLWGRGPWAQHPKDMLMWKARHRALRLFADAMAGMDVAEDPPPSAIQATEVVEAEPVADPISEAMERTHKEIQEDAAPAED